MARLTPSIIAAVLAVLAALFGDLLMGALAMGLAALGLLRGAWGRIAIIGALVVSLGAIELSGAVGIVSLAIGLGGAWLVAWRAGSAAIPVGPIVVVAGVAAVFATMPWWLAPLGAYANSDAVLRVVILLAGLGVFLAWASVTAYQNRGT